MGSRTARRAATSKDLDTPYVQDRHESISLFLCGRILTCYPWLINPPLRPKPAAEGEAVPAEGGAASMEVEGKEEKEGEEKKEAAPLTVEEQLKQAGMRILQSPEVRRERGF